eukprot:SAG22_NODE_1452_length_4395_cov_2.925745_7_plen_76_part_00
MRSQPAPPAGPVGPARHKVLFGSDALAFSTIQRPTAESGAARPAGGRGGAANAANTDSQRLIAAAVVSVVLVSWV